VGGGADGDDCNELGCDFGVGWQDPEVVKGVGVALTLLTFQRACLYMYLFSFTITM
jgi:hypothetical protein